MQSSWKEESRSRLDPLVRWLVAAGVTADWLSVAGLGWAIVAAGWAAFGGLRPAAICLILSSLCDVLDGQVARLRGQAGPRGAFLDSCLDRLADGAVFCGIAWWFGGRAPQWSAVSGAALVGAYAVSYARARAEGLGIDCRVGIMERPERLVVLIVALLAGEWALGWGLVAVAVLSWVTFWQRLRHVLRAIARAGDRGV